MRKALLAALAVAILGGASVALAHNAPVEITKNGFAPPTVTVQSGDTVSWKNSDTAAHAVAVANTTCRILLQPSHTGSWPFATPGTFTYSNPSLAGRNQSNGPFLDGVSIAQHP